MSKKKREAFADGYRLGLAEGRSRAYAFMFRTGAKLALRLLDTVVADIDSRKAPSSSLSPFFPFGTSRPLRCAAPMTGGIDPIRCNLDQAHTGSHKSGLYGWNPCGHKRPADACGNACTYAAGHLGTHGNLVMSWPA